MSGLYIKLIFATGLRYQSLLWPSHGLARFCTTSEIRPTQLNTKEEYFKYPHCIAVQLYLNWRVLIDIGQD